MDNREKIEHDIAAKTLSWLESNPDANESDIESYISEEINKKNYLKVEWNKKYAVTRVLSLVNQKSEESDTPDDAGPFSLIAEFGIAIVMFIVLLFFLPLQIALVFLLIKIVRIFRNRGKSYLT